MHYVGVGQDKKVLYTQCNTIHTLPREELLCRVCTAETGIYQCIEVSHNNHAENAILFNLTSFKYAVKPVTKEFESQLNVFKDF